MESYDRKDDIGSVEKSLGGRARWIYQRNQKPYSQELDHAEFYTSIGGVYSVSDLVSQNSKKEKAMTRVKKRLSRILPRVLHSKFGAHGTRSILVVSILQTLAVCM